ncbi:MAG TPA: hypothetical protein VN843_00985 [Anaerolineales bacterium]|nr:hypothetical protein [Anaerolineales bacterium]
MRLIRLLGVVVILYGFSYLFQALLQILGSILSGSASSLLVHIIGLNLCIGTVATIVGFGLLLLQKWASIAWLATVTLLVSEHCLILFLWYLRGNDLTGQVLNVVLTSFLALISWTKLTSESTKKHFV